MEKKIMGTSVGYLALGAFAVWSALSAILGRRSPRYCCCRPGAEQQTENHAGRGAGSEIAGDGVAGGAPVPAGSDGETVRARDAPLVV